MSRTVEDEESEDGEDGLDISSIMSHAWRSVKPKPRKKQRQTGGLLDCSKISGDSGSQHHRYPLAQGSYVTYLLERLAGDKTDLDAGIDVLLDFLVKLASFAVFLSMAEPPLEVIKSPEKLEISIRSPLWKELALDVESLSVDQEEQLIIARALKQEIIIIMPVRFGVPKHEVACSRGRAGSV